MSRLFPILLIIALTANASGGVVDLAPQRGRAVTAIRWIDEKGRARELSQFGGYPLILLPIYTRCPGPCIQNVAQLKKSLSDSNGNPTEFRVLLFSFDATDTPSVLAEYRRRENIPLGWSIGTASQPNIDALLESIGFQVGKAGAEFMHPNMLLFLDGKLRIAKWISGTNYSGRDIDTALKIALGQSDWIGQHSDALYAILLFAAALLCVALFHHLRQHRIDAHNARLIKQTPSL